MHLLYASVQTFLYLESTVPSLQGFSGPQTIEPTKIQGASTDNPWIPAQ